MRRHHGRFGTRESRLLLGGEPTYEAREIGPATAASFGYLRGWYEAEVDEAFSDLVS